MRLYFTSVFIFFVLCGKIFSQDYSKMRGAEYCSYSKIHSLSSHSPDAMSPNSPKHSFNVLDYKLELNLYNCYITPYPKTFLGSNTITFMADSVLNSIKLNAVNTSLQVDSVSMAGTTFTHLSDVLTINLDKTYNPGDTVKVKIYYEHLNVADNAFYVSSGFVFTVCAPEGARKWFPCWDRPSDKTTFELIAKVPGNVMLASNGKLVDSTIVADTIYYHWKSRDPMATYLINIASKAGYNLDIVYWHKLSNPNDSVPMRFYYNAGENPKPMENIIGDMTTYYSQKFCEHPFEKNGFATLNSSFPWAGMENQTITNLCPNCWTENLIAHEYSHQWFGDMITCGTWSDVSLNEGFATYCESLWKEHTGGYNSYKAKINMTADNYLTSNPGWPIYDSSWAVVTPNINTLYNTAITYDKGACVLHMLRYVIGDSLFFEFLKEYSADTNLKYDNAVMADYISVAESVSGQNLDWFFNQWIYKPNHPVYENKYTIDSIGAGNWNVKFTINQTQTNPQFFKMPVELKFTFSDSSDTVMKVMNDSNNQDFSFNFSKKPITTVFDPFRNIIIKVEKSHCIGTESLTAVTDTVEDGSGEYNYGDNSSCTWDIQPSNNPQSIVLHFLEFDTENTNDKLEVWNGIALPNVKIATYSGSAIPTDLVCSTKRVKLKFITNNSITAAGWKLLYTTQNEGINEKSDDVKLFLYPNPATNKITVELNDFRFTNYELRIYDIRGQELIKAQGIRQKAKVDISNLPSGIYFIKVVNENGVSVGKIIKCKK
ncbi:MAG: M1 family aminopeptidase [Bacteroidales bacterium]|nr:M1 family aminopeptidase [Bacteroidales bacterium]